MEKKQNCKTGLWIIIALAILVVGGLVGIFIKDRFLSESTDCIGEEIKNTNKENNNEISSDNLADNIGKVIDIKKEDINLNNEKHQLIKYYYVDYDWRQEGNTDILGPSYKLRELVKLDDDVTIIDSIIIQNNSIEEIIKLYNENTNDNHSYEISFLKDMNDKDEYFIIFYYPEFDSISAKPIRDEEGYNIKYSENEYVKYNSVYHKYLKIVDLNGKTIIDDLLFQELDSATYIKFSNQTDRTVTYDDILDEKLLYYNGRADIKDNYFYYIEGGAHCSDVKEYKFFIKNGIVNKELIKTYNEDEYIGAGASC